MLKKILGTLFVIVSFLIIASVFFTIVTFSTVIGDIRIYNGKENFVKLPVKIDSFKYLSYSEGNEGVVLFSNDFENNEKLSLRWHIDYFLKQNSDSCFVWHNAEIDKTIYALPSEKYFPNKRYLKAIFRPFLIILFLFIIRKALKYGI